MWDARPLAIPPPPQYVVPTTYQYLLIRETGKNKGDQSENKSSVQSRRQQHGQSRNLETLFSAQLDFCVSRQSVQIRRTKYLLTLSFSLYDCCKRDHQDNDNNINTITHLLLFLHSRSYESGRVGNPPRKVAHFQSNR